MGSCETCVLAILYWSKQQVAGLALIGQGILSLMWSIQTESAGEV